MRSTMWIGALAMTFAAMTGCDSTSDSPPSASDSATPAGGPAAPAGGPAAPAADSPYRPVASIRDLMRSVITFSAETYWQSVSIVMDLDGYHENHPETDEEWQEVWAAGITLAESGNLLLMPPRAVDEPEWRQFSEDLISAGLAAAQVAADRDFEAVLEHGEYIYNVCLACHQKYVPAMPDL
jgi:microsomal dipeptidase-like Zn-dependent dipeptidase